MITVNGLQNGMCSVFFLTVSNHKIANTLSCRINTTAIENAVVLTGSMIYSYNATTQKRAGIMCAATKT